MKLSVIIPIYNTMTCIERCVNYVLYQDYKDVEIILVDDGSTDGTSEMCDAVAEVYPQVVVLHQPNGGTSMARNNGIRKATGDYIAFIDSDDHWIPNVSLSALMEEANKYQPDLLLFRRYDAYIGGKTVLGKKYDTQFINSHPVEEVFHSLVQQDRFESSACFQFVKRSLVIDNEIYFKGGLVCEDMHWNLQLWPYVKSVRAVDKCFYAYIHREGSITTTFSMKHVNSYDYIFTFWEEKIKNGCAFKDEILGYLANRWVSCAYALRFMEGEDRTSLIESLERHKMFLKHACSKKANMAKWLCKFFNVATATKLLAKYKEIQQR